MKEERTSVLNTDNKTDLIIKVIKNKVDIILRLKFTLKKRDFKVKPLSINDVLLVSLTDIKELSDKLAPFNAKKCFIISNALYDAGEYRDSYLYLHLSLEHLLKYLLAKTINAYGAKYLDSLPVGEDQKGKSNNRSHDVTSILIYMQKIIIDFRKSVKFSSLMSVLNKAKSKYEWTEIRYYIDPDDSKNQDQYKQYCKELKKQIIYFNGDLKRLGLFK